MKSATVACAKKPQISWIVNISYSLSPQEVIYQKIILFEVRFHSIASTVPQFILSFDKSDSADILLLSAVRFHSIASPQPQFSTPPYYRSLQYFPVGKNPDKAWTAVSPTPLQPKNQYFSTSLLNCNSEQIRRSLLQQCLP